MKRETRLIHSGRPKGEGPVNAPVARASTMLADTGRGLYLPEPGVRTYARGGLSPNTELAAAIAALYGAEGSVLAPSGLAAQALALTAAVEGPGTALISDSVYRPVRRFCDEELPRFGVEPVYYDPEIGAGIAGLLSRDVRVVMLESPGSLTFEVQDVPAIAAAARAAGARTVIDDTWSAGWLMNPLALGVDFAAQSLTKYVGGHADLLMGAVTASGEALERVRRQAQVTGVHVSPDDAFLALRGLRTLPLRLERSGAGGLALAERLASHPRIARVLHPALPDHPGHAIYRRDFSGPAGCFSVVVAGLDLAGGEALVDGLGLFGRGFSWGGFESLALPCDRQLKRTARPWRAEGAVIRLAVGLEDVEDLWTDLERALG